MGKKDLFPLESESARAQTVRQRIKLMGHYISKNSVIYSKTCDLLFPNSSIFNLSLYIIVLILGLVFL